MAVNVTGVMRLSRAVLPLMLDAGGGAIVTVASKASLGAGASGVAYTTSKHAVIGLVKSIACFYGAAGDPLECGAARPGGDQHRSDRRPEGDLGGGAGATGTGNDRAAGTARRDRCGDLVARQRRGIQHQRRNVGRRRWLVSGMSDRAGVAPGWQQWRTPGSRSRATMGRAGHSPVILPAVTPQVRTALNRRPRRPEQGNGSGWHLLDGCAATRNRKVVGSNPTSGSELQVRAYMQWPHRSPCLHPYHPLCANLASGGPPRSAS
jgi:short subunit dehydrogenase